MLHSISKMISSRGELQRPSGHPAGSICMRKDTCWLAAIVFTCLLAVSRLASCADTNTGRQLTILDGNNFKLTARVLVLAAGDTSGVSADVAVNEFYSNEFQKAKITLKWQKFENWIMSTNNMINYIYEHGRSQLMKTRYRHQSRRDECELADRAQFVSDLFSAKITRESADLSERHWFNNKRLGVPDHLIGLARLLALVDSNRANLVPVNENNQIIRNHETKKYSLIVDLGSGTKVNMRVYIGQGADTGPQAEFPHRVGLQTPEGTELVVDFYSLEPIRRRMHWNEIFRRYVTVQDLFAYPTGGGCSALIKQDYHNPWAVHLYESDRKVVSFRMELAEFRPLLGDERHVSQAFVAYDGYAKAYRKDQLRGDSYAITIHDALAGRKYNIRQPMAPTNPLAPDYVDSALGGNKLKVLQDGGQSSHGECFSTMSPDSMLFESPYEPVLPIERLVDMGLAIVRGTLCKILETTSSSLPRLFFSHVAYSDQENNLRQRFKPDELAGDTNETIYTIDYYVAVQNTTVAEGRAESNGVNLPQAMKLGQLMRVTVSQNSFLLYRVEVHEFQWSLSEAPNGDKQEELFALKNRCNNNLKLTSANQVVERQSSSNQSASILEDSDDGSIGQLSLDLVYTEAPQTAFLKASHIRDLIGQAPVRNKALVRALSQLSNGITSSEIYGIKSRVHLADDGSLDGGHNLSAAVHDHDSGHEEQANGVKKVKITASLRLVHSRPQLYHPMSLANGTWARWQLPTGGEPTRTEPKTFDECLWMASQFRPTHRSLLFSYCYDSCAIDLEADLEFPRDSKRPKFLNSDVFELGDHYQCPIFYLDVADDDAMGHRTKSWPFIYSTLANKLLTMPLLDSNSDPPVENLFFKVDRIELNNLQWWRSSAAVAHDDPKGMVGVRPSQGSASIDGLGLVADQRFVELAELPPTTTDGDILQTSSMDVSSCHARCVADLRCKTYSTCLVAGQIECHLSGLSLRGGDTLQDIGKKLGEYRANGRAPKQNNTIEVDINLGYSIIDANDAKFDENGELETSSGADQQKAKLKLKVDKRCRIHHKLALELFRQIPRSSEVLLDRNLVAASSVEECAEFCLQKNAQFFSRMARSKSRIAEQLQSQPKDDQMGPAIVNNRTEWRLRLLDDMKYWCSNFKYSDLGQGSVSYQVVGKLGLDKITKGGICSLTRPSLVQKNGFKLSDLTSSRKDGGPDKLRMDNFEFIYSNLYERQRGIRLLGSIAKPSNEADTQNGTTPAASMLMVVLNQQAVEEQSQVENCARACFSQTLNMVPWCRSFDLMEIEFDSTKSFFCIYNSMTLQEASKFDQYMVVNETYFPENSPGDTVLTTRKVFWHFEPRSEYTLDNLVLETMLLKGESDSDGFEASISHFWSRLLTCLLAIFTGIAITGLSYRYCARWLGHHQDGPRMSLSIPVINDDQLRDDGGL